MDDLHNGGRMTLADELFDLTTTALKTCSPQQRTIYQLVHGITDDGTIQPRTLEAAARLLDLSRSAARWHLAMAEVAVYKHIAQTMIREKHATTWTDQPAGITTINDAAAYGLSVRTRSKQAYDNIDLGAGSTEVVRANRIGSATHRNARLINIHDHYTQRAAGHE